MKTLKQKISTDGFFVVMTDKNGTILYSNHAIYDVLGYPPEDIIGYKAGTKALWGGNMTDDFYKKFWYTISVEKKVFHGKIKNRRKDGSEFFADATVTPIVDERGEVVLYVAVERDTTEIKKIDELRSNIIALASHSLRTPLSSIKWYAEVLLGKEIGDINPEQESYLREVYEGNERMTRLVNSMLNVSRLDLESFSVVPESLSIPDVVHDVEKEVARDVEKKKIKFSVIIEKDIPLILLDRDLTETSIENIIFNAVRYTAAKGHIFVSVKLVSKDEELGEQKILEAGVVVEVKDDGCGIKKDIQDKIFYKFYRADNAQLINHDGNGLGLFTVKSIMDKTGGHVWVVSRGEGKGSCFYLFFPLVGMKPKTGSTRIMTARE